MKMVKEQRKGEMKDRVKNGMESRGKEKREDERRGREGKVKREEMKGGRV